MVMICNALPLEELLLLLLFGEVALALSTMIFALCLAMQTGRILFNCMHLIATATHCCENLVLSACYFLRLVPLKDRSTLQSRNDVDALYMCTRLYDPNCLDSSTLETIWDDATKVGNGWTMILKANNEYYKVAFISEDSVTNTVHFTWAQLF